MKKTIAVLLLLALILSSLPVAFASGTKTFYTTGKCYLRAEPDKSSKSLKTLKKGVSFNATSWETDSRGVKWYCGMYDGTFGYVSEKNLSAKKDSGGGEEKKKNVTLVTTGKCYMRKSPNKEAKTVKTLAAGTTLKATKYAVDDRGVKWYYGKADGSSGYVSEKNLKKASSDPTPSPTKKNVTLVTTGTCNLRKGPSKDYAIISSVASGKTFKSTSSEVDSRGVRWYYGTVDGKKGYISEANLKKASADPTAKPTPKPVDYSDFTDISCSVRVISKTLNMRMAPSTDYQIIHTYDNGAILYATRTNGSWAEVDDPDLGLHGYVATKYVEIIDNTTTVTPMSTVDILFPADGTYPATFTADDLFRSQTGSLMLRLNICTEDLFDIVDIAQLKKGDTIVLGGQPVEVTSLAKDGMILINGTYILQPVEESNCYTAFTAEGKVYTDQGMTMLPIAEDIAIEEGAQSVVIESGLITAVR